MKSMLKSAIGAVFALGVVACQAAVDEPDSGDVVEAVDVAAVEAPERAETAPGRPEGPPPDGERAGPPPGGPGGPGGPPPEPTSALTPSNIAVYKTVEGADLSLHIFNPEGHTAESESPALLFYHGGGFRRGSPVQGYTMSEAFNPLGIVVIAVEYRLRDTDDRTLDQIVADAKSSVRWVRANADDLGVDPNRIATSGHSAGAYLAMATGMMDRFDEAGEDLAISSMANAMMPWSAGTQRSERNTADILPDGVSLDDFQPTAYVTDSLPPSLFVHGSVDTLITYEQAEAFSAQLAELGNVSGFKLIDGADHFFREEAQQQAVYDSMAEFLTTIGFTEE